MLLATGGAGQMYRVTSNSWESTGDGTALAYEAGAELRDMEMVQFHPTGMVWPPGVRGILVTEGVRGEGGVLRNKDGERFMERYDPERMELSSRDVVARAINSEVGAGAASPHGGVFLDITHRKPEFIKSKLPRMYEQFLKLAKVDITKEPMEVAPTIHYAMGGMRVEAETGATHRPRALCRGRGRGGPARRQPAWRQLAVATCSCSASARASGAAPPRWQEPRKAEAGRSAGQSKTASADAWRRSTDRRRREPIRRSRRRCRRR